VHYLFVNIYTRGLCSGVIYGLEFKASNELIVYGMYKIFNANLLLILWRLYLLQLSNAIYINFIVCRSTDFLFFLLLKNGQQLYVATYNTNHIDDIYLKHIHV